MSFERTAHIWHQEQRKHRTMNKYNMTRCLYTTCSKFKINPRAHVAIITKHGLFLAAFMVKAFVYCVRNFQVTMKLWLEKKKMGFLQGV